MKQGKAKLTPVFKTKEEEELFARCAIESMNNITTGGITHLPIDESMNNGNVVLTPVFQTKEEEELFARCAQETMIRYSNNEAVKKRVLKQ